MEPFSWLIFALVLAGGGLKALGDISSGIQAQRQAEVSARSQEQQALASIEASRIERQNALIAVREAERKESGIESEAERATRIQRARAAAAGVTGISPIAAELDIAERAVEEIEIVQYAGEIERLNRTYAAAGAEHQAKLFDIGADISRQQGKQALTLGIVQSVTSLLGAAATAFSFGAAAGLFGGGTATATGSATAVGSSTGSGTFSLGSGFGGGLSTTVPIL